MSFSILDSPAFLTLSPLARSLYFDFRRQLNGPTNNGLIAAAATELDRCGQARSTVKKYIPQLIERGLIEQTRQGGIAYMSKICSLYGFCDCDIVDAPTKQVKGKRASLAFREWRTPPTPNQRPP